MAKNYSIHHFSYIDDAKGRNTLNGTIGVDWDEVCDEYPVVCFNGLAYFRSKFADGSVHHFKLTYPKFNTLTWEDKERINLYCGFIPNGGEYGVVCGTFGEVKEISKNEFNALMVQYPIKKKDYHLIDWLCYEFTEK